MFTQRVCYVNENCQKHWRSTFIVRFRLNGWSETSDEAAKSERAGDGEEDYLKQFNAKFMVKTTQQTTAFIPAGPIDLHRTELTVNADNDQSPNVYTLALPCSVATPALLASYPKTSANEAPQEAHLRLAVSAHSTQRPWGFHHGIRVDGSVESTPDTARR